MKLVASLLLGLVHAVVSLPVKVNEVTVKNPSVCSIAPNFPSSSPGPSVLLTEFAGFGKDSIYAISDLGALLSSKGSPANLTTLTHSQTWPNQADEVPVSYFDSYLFLAAGGFLVPGKSLGSVALYDVAGTRYQISNDKNGYFYHHAIWYDFNGDGRMDVLTARVNKPTLGKSHGELFWLEQPSSDPLSGPWKEHLLTTGPDVSFVFEDLNGDGKPELVATEFFTSSNLMLYTCGEKSWGDCDENSVSSYVIDGKSGPFFNVETDDLNMDGKKELLVTNNRDDGTGSVFAYEIPKDLTTGNWTQHTLSTGYKPKTMGMGKGAPGTALAFLPETKAKKERPSILVSGDDGGVVKLLTPTATDFVYTEDTLVDVKGTIGTIAAADVNGDGYTDFFVPRYNDKSVDVFTFAPQSIN